MNDEDEKELEQRRLTDEVRQTVERELKKRYSWIGLILAVVMGSLITLLVRQSLAGAEVQLKVTEKLSERVNDQLVDLEQRAKSLGRHLADVTEQSLRFSDDLRTQINEHNNVDFEIPNELAHETRACERSRWSQMLVLPFS